MKYIVHNSEFITWAEDPFSHDGEKFHAVLCDPPYGIAFMGKEWDKPDAFRRAKNENDVGRKSVFGRTSRTSPEYSAGLAFQKQAESWGRALLPLLYPGAIVMMFSGTRMWHRLAAGMEDAGFHLWDTLMWLHGQGFPKAQDISKLIDKENPNQDWSGFKTPQLKPAWEPVLCFRAPANGMKYAELAIKYGSGCLNIDSGRIAATDSQLAEKYASVKNAPPRLNNVFGTDTRPRSEQATEPNPAGRFPANVVFDEVSAEILDKQSGNRIAGKSNGGALVGEQSNNIPFRRGKLISRNDVGGASRFFYVAKVSRAEREAGLENFEDKSYGHSPADRCAKCNKQMLPAGNGVKCECEIPERIHNKSKNTHPTLKPIELTRWLASLLLPPDSVKPRRLLVPFSGVGSEMIGAIQAGWDEVIGIEMDSEYCKIAEARLNHHKNNKPIL